MSITFNANEIFEMAEEIERNGAKFYRQAAEKTDNKELKDFLLSLALMEDNHLVVFEEMRKELKPQEKGETVYDPYDESIQYLQAMSDSHSWEGRVEPGQELTGKESMKEIIEIALNSEKESVVFYYGLRSLVSAKAGQDKIEKIILEELNHITTLLNHLKELN